MKASGIGFTVRLSTVTLPTYLLPISGCYLEWIPFSSQRPLSMVLSIPRCDITLVLSVSPNGKTGSLIQGVLD
jgi:hypothetical protein